MTDAILGQAEKALLESLACFTLVDSEVVFLGRETIYRNGESAGWLSSGGWGYTVNTYFGYGYPVSYSYSLGMTRKC